MSFQRQLLENLAAESDARTVALDEVWWGEIRGELAMVNEDNAWAIEEIGMDPEEPVRIRFAVCPLCNGKGRHVNPSVDAHGLSREDFDDDPDFRESYLAGDYDIDCNLCRGERVVPVPLDAEVASALVAAAQERWDYRSEQLAEMRYGA